MVDRTPIFNRPYNLPDSVYSYPRSHPRSRLLRSSNTDFLQGILRNSCLSYIRSHQSSTIFLRSGASCRWDRSCLCRRNAIWHPLFPGAIVTVPCIFQGKNIGFRACGPGAVLAAGGGDGADSEGVGTSVVYIVREIVGGSFGIYRCNSLSIFFRQTS